MLSFSYFSTVVSLSSIGAAKAAATKTAKTINIFIFVMYVCVCGSVQKETVNLARRIRGSDELMINEQVALAFIARAKISGINLCKYIGVRKKYADRYYITFKTKCHKRCACLRQSQKK